MESFIISGFLNILSKIKELYKNSFLFKIFAIFSGFVNKLIKKSLFVKSLTLAENESFKKSFIYKKLIWAKSLINKLLFIIPDCFLLKLKQSKILICLLNFFENIFNFRIRVYGIFIFFASIGFLISGLIIQRFSKTTLIISILFCVISFLITLINPTIKQLFSSSIIKKLAYLIFEIDEKDNNNAKIKEASFGFLIFAGLFFGIIGGLLPIRFFVLLCLGIFLISLIIYKFEIGVFLCVLLAPFVPTMLLLVLIILSYASLFIKFIINKKLNFAIDGLSIWIFVFIILSLINAIFSYTPFASLKITLLVSTFISFYYILFNTIKNKNEFEIYLNIFLTCGFIVALYGIYQNFAGIAVENAWTDTEMFADIKSRVYSTFANPNVLGEYLILLIPLCLSFAITRKNILSKVFYYTNLLTLCVCLVLTQSRGCWIGLIIAMLIFILIYEKRFIWLFIAALLILPFIMPQSVINRFTSIGNLSDSSSAFRLYIWLGTINMLKEFWFCGVGQGINAYNMVYPYFSYYEIISPHAHNLFLVTITEMGAFGLLALLIILGVYFKNTAKSITASNDKKNKLYQIAFLTAVVAFLIQGIFDYVFYNYRVLLIFFMFICFAMINKRFIENKE